MAPEAVYSTISAKGVRFSLWRYQTRQEPYYVIAWCEEDHTTVKELSEVFLSKAQADQAMNQCRYDSAIPTRYRQQANIDSEAPLALGWGRFG